MRKRIYADYSPDKEYAKKIYNSREDDRTEAEERARKALEKGDVKCMYVTNTYKDTNVKSGDTILTAQIYPAFYHKSDVPQGTAEKEKRREIMRNLNDKRARRELTRLVNINFGKGDLWITLGYDNENIPDSAEKAQKDIQGWIRRVNYRRKKLGMPSAKYIYVTEWEEDEKKGKIRCHHHIIMDGDLDRDTVEQCWGLCKRPNSRKLVPDEAGLSGVAEYISKDPRGSKRWKASKNLVRPAEATKSYTKFKKRTVGHMAIDYEYLRMQLESKYKGFTFLDCELYYNERQALFYIYARLTKKGVQKYDKRKANTGAGRDREAKKRNGRTEKAGKRGRAKRE